MALPVGMTTILSASRSAGRRVTRRVGLRVNRGIGQIVRGPLSSLSIQIGLIAAALTFASAFVSGLAVLAVSNGAAGLVISPLAATVVACARAARPGRPRRAHLPVRPPHHAR